MDSRRDVAPIYKIQDKSGLACMLLLEKLNNQNFIVNIKEKLNGFLVNLLNL